MPQAIIDPSQIAGWGVDADPLNDPTYPMRDRTGDDSPGMNWIRPPLQGEDVEVLQSIEHNRPPAVHGASSPPKGLSGAIRRYAFRFSESQWAHWLLLMGADRINVIEGLFQDLGRGRLPNVFAEMGLNAELKHNKRSFLTHTAVAASVVVGLVVVGVIIDRRG